MATAEPTRQDNIYLPRPAEVVRVEPLTVAERLFEFRFLDGKDLGHKPGQFVEISLYGFGEAPISITSSPTKKGSFELAVRAVGNVTNAIHRMEPGAKVGIRGPFGNGFPVDELLGRDILFVAGGIGLFPLRSLINYVLDRRNLFGRVVILFGSRRPAEQLFLSELAAWRASRLVEYHETVDRGDDTWKGNVGVITTLFSRVEIKPERTAAVIVGPPVMYRFVIAECLKKGIDEDHMILSLERRMKCGVGKCGHCQINGVYVCQEGPVFTYAQLKSLKEAV
jgi:NAD(P)H-flavin reductase